MKIKLSQYLVENKYYPNRSQAHNAIKERKVRVNGIVITKDGYLVSDDDEITVEKLLTTYVSRGGHKLEAALKEFGISLKNKAVLDIGASTGGFTDCCLQNGARIVYAYDVGHDQLNEKLKKDDRVVSNEGINARFLKKSDFVDEIDFICMDVSFISCTKIFEAISDILSSNKQAVILFKPQFEVGKEFVNKKGLVNDKNAISQALVNCQNEASNLQLSIEKIIPSPIKGQDGNQEYLLLLTKDGKKTIELERGML